MVPGSLILNQTTGWAKKVTLVPAVNMP